MGRGMFGFCGFISMGKMFFLYLLALKMPMCRRVVCHKKVRLR